MSTSRKKPSRVALPPFPIPPGLPPGSYVLGPDGIRPIEHTPGKPMKRYKRDPLENHPRAAETRELMAKALVEDEVEVIDLQASELACDVADLWLKAKSSVLLLDHTGRQLYQAIMRLELVTRPSAMRKVRP